MPISMPESRPKVKRQAALNVEVRPVPQALEGFDEVFDLLNPLGRRHTFVAQDPANGQLFDSWERVPFEYAAPDLLAACAAGANVGVLANLNAGKGCNDAHIRWPRGLWLKVAAGSHADLPCRPDCVLDVGTSRIFIWGEEMLTEVFFCDCDWPSWHRLMRDLGQSHGSDPAVVRRDFVFPLPGFHYTDQNGDRQLVRVIGGGV